MGALPALRIVAAFCLDASLAALTGLLLARTWLARSAGQSASAERPRFFRALPLAAISLLIGLCAHLYLLTADFTGQTTPMACFAELPGMLHTHAGWMDAGAIILALFLCGATLLARRSGLRNTALTGTCALLVSVSLLLRAATGHAAVQGNFTVEELLQASHLAAMAVWSGGVLVSGFAVLPSLQREAARPLVDVRAYMGRLSRASTWAVALVFLSGLVKSYRALGGALHPLFSGAWGGVLVAKVICVCAALALGGMNRLWLGSPKPWDATATRRSRRALQLEAWCMLLVLALSAALGALDPPDTAS